jgi:putative PIN family toxin of toxin-antitoxin system
VLISATFWTGKPKQLLNKVRRGEITFLTSESLLNELREVLIREDKPFKLSPEEAQRIVETIRGLAEMVETWSEVNECRDEKDNRVLECAVDGGAMYIISGDLHLLELKSFKNIKVSTVSKFLSNF